MNIDKIYYGKIYLTTFYNKYHIPNEGYYHDYDSKFIKNVFAFYDFLYSQYINIENGDIYKYDLYYTKTGEMYFEPVKSFHDIYYLLYGKDKHHLPKRKVLKITNEILTKELENRNNEND